MPRPRPSAIAAALLLAWMVALQGCASAPTAQDLTDEDYVRNFRTVAFYREFDADKIQQPLTRWEGPLRVALVGDVKTRYSEYTRLHLEDLASLTGLDIALAPHEEANILVILSPEPFERALDTYRADYRSYFSSDRAMEAITAQMKAEATCYARVITDEADDNVITGAMALIPTDQGRFVVRACIIEELTQAMGLFNDSDEIRPSIFNDSSPNMVLTEHDRILLRVLYDSRLRPGMTWTQAEPVVRLVVAKLRG